VRIDPGQVDQLLANLVVNARDAMPGGGQIRLQTANHTVDESWNRRNPEAVPGDFVQLAVTDTGGGMDVETQAHLFEPFFTTKPVGQGTGLGLATVYGIIKQNGGFIDVRTERGRGTTFQLMLPRVAAAAMVVEPPVVRPSQQGTETILLVEDEAQVLGLGRRLLELHGYTVLTARHPDEALRVAATHAGPIHLLLTDVVMPSMNGRVLSRQMAGVKPGVKYLFMSGYPANAIAHQGLLEDGVRFLQKPFTVEELTHSVREALDAA
jgi:CheY-like chemotaxis protein